MQLKPLKLGRLAAGLSMLSANLIAANAALAQDTSAQDISTNAAQIGAPLSQQGPNAGIAGLMDEGAPGPGTLVLDNSVLFYQESGSRVRAIEPVFNGEYHLEDGSIASFGLTIDSLTGATPNGAVPYTTSQTFNSIVRIPTSTEVTSTGASGGGVVTSIPGTTYGHSTYTTPANTLPLASFHDHRTALNGSYLWYADPDTRLSAGGAFSVERDYTTASGNISIAHDFNQKNTTLSLSVNGEQDLSRPYNGTPLPFENLNSQIAGGDARKSIVGVLAGVTQSLTRFWLTQLNYNFTLEQGEQSDPYRVLSVVDALTGMPLDYLYESRPHIRQRQSVYWDNKLTLGPTVADVSLRYYHDSWGINSLTTEVSEQIPLGRFMYIKPMFRYYHQSAANFFQYYLTNGQPLPQYASSDSRLGRFNATTIGGKFGIRLIENTEFYVDAEDYRQTGQHYDPSAPGALSGVNLFSGINAFSVMAGVRINL